MIDRATKLRWRRKIKRSRLQVEDYNQSAEINLEKNVFKRFHRLNDVKRFILVWISLIVLLLGVTLFQIFDTSQYYQKPGYSSGGNFYEGAIGVFTNANPLFATGDLNSTVSNLLFPGLLKFNQKNQLVGDLAKSWSVDASGQNYTVNLRPNLRWQDGKPLTATDVIFTYNTIENPDVQSSLFNNWYGTKITKINNLTIKFTISSPLSSFPNELTNGIIPKHIFASIPATQLESSSFNNVNPIGAGPFKLASLATTQGSSAAGINERIDLVPNSYYYQGKPKLSGFNLIAYANQVDLLKAFISQNIQAMIGIDSIPNSLINNQSVYIHYIPITAETMVFYRNNSNLLSDVKLRKAMSEAIDTQQVMSQLSYPALPIRGPLLPTMIGYSNKYDQVTNNISDANQILDSLGWTKKSDGYRYKDSQELQLSLYTQNTPDYLNVAYSLLNQWRKIGVKVQLVKLSSLDIKSVIAYKTYDMLLYSIAVGNDPDVFAYWDSAQAQSNAIPGLNLSIYKSTTADDSLAAGRTRFDPALRAIKYVPFLQSWQADYPALALYQPNYLFVTRPKINNFNPYMINAVTDIYTNVNNWEIKQVKITNQ
ncbi:MAG TPA: peptide ABC transporter substrate-binding protein [Candidatus Dormibacteraeota bacterium]|nr:peptide ABC transporter substrate-binding protein [Candidatus Dormibacteraeota bacterium]